MKAKMWGVILVVAGGAILALTVLLGSWYTVDEGERGVILRNGAVIGTAAPGLHFKIPIIDSVAKISVQARARIYERVLSYSRDQQPADLAVSVNYRLPIDQVGEIYASYGSEDGLLTRLLDRRVYEQVKNVFGKFNAVTAIQERTRLNRETEEAIREDVKGPVIIESFQIENVDFSDTYEQSIEARMLAEVEVQKIRQNAEREKIQAEITVIKAKAAADAVRAEAEAQGEAIRIKGDAEASAIQARGEALRNNPQLIGLVQAEKWNGLLPQTMIPGATVPFLNVLPTQETK